MYLTLRLIENFASWEYVLKIRKSRVSLFLKIVPLLFMLMVVMKGVKVLTFSLLQAPENLASRIVSQKPQPYSS